MTVEEKPFQKIILERFPRRMNFILAVLTSKYIDKEFTWEICFYNKHGNLIKTARHIDQLLNERDLSALYADTYDLEITMEKAFERETFNINVARICNIMDFKPLIKTNFSNIIDKINERVYYGSLNMEF